MEAVNETDCSEKCGCGSSIALGGAGHTIASIMAQVCDWRGEHRHEAPASEPRIVERCHCGSSVEVSGFALNVLGGVVDLWRAEHACMPEPVVLSAPVAFDPMESGTGALLATVARLHELVGMACAGWENSARNAGSRQTSAWPDQIQTIRDEAERISK